MNKLLSLLVVSFLLVSVKMANAADILSWNLEEVTAGSETIKGPVYIKAVFLTTPTPNTFSDYAVLIASPNTRANTSLGSFTSDMRKSPPLVFTSTYSFYNGGTGDSVNGMYKAIDYGEHGIFISTDCTLWKSQVSSGEAFKAYIQYRK